MVGDFFAQDGVWFTDNFEFFFGDFTDNPNTQTWAWEWLAPYQAVWHPQRRPQGTYFVLEEGVEGLNQLELHIFWQTAHVVVRLDSLGCLGPRLDDVGVEGPLG